MATSRDYTSITDELELQISTPIQERATSPAPSQPLQVRETPDDTDTILSSQKISSYEFVFRAAANQ